MNKRNIVLVIMIVVGILRLLISFQTQGFVTDESYFHLRHIQSIQETGLPLFTDSLSYLGTQYAFNPVSYYFFAALTFFFDTIVTLKILGAISAMLCIWLFYLITKKVTQNETYQLFATSIGAFLPFSFLLFTTHFSLYILFIPLMLWQVYLFLQWTQEKKGFALMIFAFLLGAVLHSFFLLVLVGFLSYVAFMIFDKREVENDQKEFFIVLTLITLLVNYIVYYRAFIEHGFSMVFTQALPLTSLLTFLSQFGVFVIASAIAVLYFRSHRRHTPYIILIGGYFIATVIFTVLSFMTLSQGFYLLSLFSGLLLPVFFEQITTYFNKTKISTQTLVYTVFGLLFVSVALPAFLFAPFEETTHDISIEQLEWIRDNTAEDSIILAPYEISNYLMYHAQRKTIASVQRPLFSQYSDQQELHTLANNALFSSTVSEILTNLGIDSDVFVFTNNEVKELLENSQQSFLTQDCSRQRIVGVVEFTC